jgi:SAM-dependent methyltransferase
MSSAKEHYEALLGRVYEWSVAARGNPFALGAEWLARADLERASSYLDLGAGFGAHVVPLAKLGKSVTAVDFDPTLLAQLRQAVGPELPQVSVVEADLLDFVGDAGARRWDVILCAGDTVTHLPTFGAVRSLLTRCAEHLDPGAVLAIQFRDTTRFSAQGVSRFIEVARDSRRVMHCFLEPLSEEHLRVTDLVTDVGPTGPTTRISDYLKLRLAPSCLAAWGAEAGLRVEQEWSHGGMVSQVFRRS